MSSNNSFQAHHFSTDDGEEEKKDLDITEFFAYLTLLVERLGGECFISRYQIQSALNAMETGNLYLQWYDSKDRDGVVFKAVLKT